MPKRIFISIALTVVIIGVGLWVWTATDEKTAGFLGTLAGIAVGAVSVVAGWSTRAKPSETGDILKGRLDWLAQRLIIQWSEEQRVRQGKVKWPLPVRFDVPEYADTVMASWSEIREQPDGEPMPLEGIYEECAKIFNQLDSPKRFVVLGGVGAGKSLFTLRLTVDLLKDKSINEVPVLLSVSSWDPTGCRSLDEWVISRLVEDYPPLRKSAITGRVPRRNDDNDPTIAWKLVHEQQIIPILDGLDEMAEENRRKALRLLSRAAERGRPFVVTCRTKEYVRLITESEDAEPLARTPVIELKPLTVHDIRKVLLKSKRPQRWNNLIARAVEDPDGPIASAFSTPFAVWLATMAYRSPDRDPDEMLAMPTAAAIESHLLENLIPAAYKDEIGPQDKPTYPERTPQQVAQYRSTLTFLARHLHGDTRDKQTYDLAWWRLYQTIPTGLFTLVVALLIGVPCGVAFAMTARLGSPVADIGGGLAFGAVLGFLGGRAARNDIRPRLISLSLEWSRIATALFAGCLVGAAFGVVCAVAFGGPDGVENGLLVGAVIGVTGFVLLYSLSGWEAGIEFAGTLFVTYGVAGFLSAGNPRDGLLVGLVVGVPAGLNAVFTVSVYQKAETTKAISPTTLFQSARLSVLGVLPMSGISVGAAYALAVNLPAGIAACVATVLGLLFSSTAWGIHLATRHILALRHGLPLHLLRFLVEAHARGILRQVGGMYQFRHVRLAEHLRAPQHYEAAEPSARHNSDPTVVS